MSTLTVETLAALTPFADELAAALDADERALALSEPTAADATDEAPSLMAALRLAGLADRFTPSPAGDGYNMVGSLDVATEPQWDNPADESDPGTILWEITGRVDAPDAPEGVWFRETATNAAYAVQRIAARLPGADAWVRKTVVRRDAAGRALVSDLIAHRHGR